MKISIFVSLATVMSLGLASPASAQIISTMVPTQRLSSQPGGGAVTGGGPRPVTFHVMGGYTHWQFGYIADAQQFAAENTGDTVTGGRHGFIGAADIAARVGENMSVGVGGWVNKVGDVVTRGRSFVNAPGYTNTQTIGMYSVYANLFYKHIGVQAGVVPVRSEENLVIDDGTTFTGDASQTDMNVFAVGRFSSTRPEQRRWSAMVGGGLYRYGAQTPTEFSPETFAENAFTAFANGSVGIYKDLSLDVSLWYTSQDSGYSPNSSFGNAAQTRFTVGVGYGR